MMKVSDPIIFGHAVSIFFESIFTSHKAVIDPLGVNLRNGFGDLVSKIENLSTEEKTSIYDTLNKVYQEGPAIAMVDSDKGITNLHVPSDVIIDASMPAAIRSSGQMWNASGQLQDTNFIIPDRCYSGVYAETLEFCKKNGAFDPSTMGSVSNVGLMAQKAEEYGSHDKTFEAPEEGVIKIITDEGALLLEHKVQKGDIWRACQVKDAVVQNWVNLAVERSRDTGQPAVFWLNEDRAHDAQLITKVERYLSELDTDGLEIHILAPVEATRFSTSKRRQGYDFCPRNVLRDYLTDLFYS